MFASRSEHHAVIDIDKDAGQRLSVGNDSDVYRFGDVVAKVYKKLSIDEVARYAELQNAAVQALERLRYHATIAIRGVPHTIAMERGTPVDRVGVTSSGQPVTFSRYIAAPNLEKLMFKPEAFDRYADAELSDPGLRAFGADMNRLFWSEYPTRVQDEFHYHVCMLSRLLDRELGVSGLYIGKYNVKLQPVPAEPRIDLIVTDIAVYLDRVRYPANGSPAAFPDAADEKPLAVDLSKRYVVRYLNPTANKPLHLGHLRNVVLGEATAASLGTLGAEVTRHCVVEDTGRFMTEAMAAVAEFEREHDLAAAVAELGKPDQFVGSCYAEYRRRRRAESPEGKGTTEYEARNDEADELQRALASGDVAAARLRQTVRALALGGQEATLRRLGISFDCCNFESEEDAVLAAFVEAGLARDLFRRNEKGETVFATSGGRDLRLVNSAGLYEESTRLLSLLRRLLGTWEPDRINVIIAGSEWKRSMSAYPEALRRLGVRQTDSAYAQAFYGMVMLRGKKMASSAGNGVLVDHLLDDLVASDGATGICESADRRLAPDEIAACVAKAMLLASPRTGRVDFDPELLYDRRRNPGWTIAAAWAATAPGGDGAECGAVSPRVRDLLLDALARVSFERVVADAARLGLAILEARAAPPTIDEFQTIVGALGLPPRDSSFAYAEAPPLEARAGRNGQPVLA